MKAKNPALLVIQASAAIMIAAIMLISCSQEKDSNSQPGVITQNSPPPSSELQSSQSEPYEVVDEMPRFPGGESELLKVIGTNTQYPQKAKEAGIEGRVIVRFVITKTGKVDRVGILEGASPELDAECIRVIENLPEFEPGRKDGQPVDVWYAVPITFTLRDSGSKLKK